MCKTTIITFRTTAEIIEKMTPCFWFFVVAIIFGLLIIQSPIVLTVRLCTPLVTCVAIPLSIRTVRFLLPVRKFVGTKARIRFLVITAPRFQWNSLVQKGALVSINAGPFQEILADSRGFLVAVVARIPTVTPATEVVFAGGTLRIH